MRRALACAALWLASASGTALAADRDFCPDRPGLGTPACVMDAGQLAVEFGGVDWTHDVSSAVRSDEVVAGDVLVRLGIGGDTEAQFGWTALGHVRTRDRSTGARRRMTGSGDVSLAIRHSLSNPDGSGLAIAVMPFATLPSGGDTIGAGDWGAGLRMPVSVDLGGGASLGLTPEIDAAVDGDRDGRHLAYGSVIGLGVDLSAAVSATLELSAMRDRDPADHATEMLSGLSLGWMVDDDTQLDLGANLGLDRDTPDAELYFGIARRF